jgi:hypothetical protein
MKIEIGNHPGLKSKKKRVVKVRIHSYDSWNLDHTLALVISPALKKFDKNHGIPASMFPAGTDFDYNNAKSREYQKIEKTAQKKWDDTLDRMRWSFDQIARHEPDEPKYPLKTSKDLSDLTKKKTPAQQAKIKKWISKINTYQARIQDGLNLFGVHYRDLWN